MAKAIAKTLTGILNNPLAKIIMNRATPVDWEVLIALWQADLFNRKPAPAYSIDGKYMGTDLDMHTFISALVQRGAMINIPTYQSMRESTVKEGQMIVSKDNRHGRCIGLSSNKDVFSFGVRIKDLNVMMSEDAGDFRVFNLLNILGEWHKGWQTIQFMPNQKENDFIEKWNLAGDDRITFEHFISKWRKYSIYSAAYFLTKMAIARLDDEAQYLAGMIKMMLKAGITYPPEEVKEWPKQEKIGDVKKVKVKSVTFKADIPPFYGEYPKIEMSQENLIKITALRKKLVYTIKPTLQYSIRGNEYANFKYVNDDNEFPHWIKNAEWQKDYKTHPTFTVNANFIKKFKNNDEIINILSLMRERSYKENELPQFYEEYVNLNMIYYNSNECPEQIKEKVKVTKGRAVYDRFIMFQGNVGAYGIGLLRKTFEKTETVNAEYE